MRRKFSATPEHDPKGFRTEFEVESDGIVGYNIRIRSLWERIKFCREEFNFISQFPITNKTEIKLEEVYANGAGVCTVVT